MRFLADESCDFAVTRALRKAGHDVLAITEHSPGAQDENVLKLAVREKRILVTEDKDFGQLVYAKSHQTGGVIFLRFPASARREFSAEVVKLIKQQGEKLFGCFVVFQPGRIRITRLTRRK